MLKVVENEPAVRRYQRKFVSSFKLLTDEVIPVELGHPGASVRARVAWSERLGIWRFSRKIADRRYWHAFGMGRPEGGARIPITCEINFPLCGIDRRTGGAFAEDGDGRAVVVHRGKLGGGRKGVGKGLFESHYRGVWEVMDDGGSESAIAVIGNLDSPRFPRQIALFVRKIARIKEAAAARSAQAELRFNELALHEEWIGDRFHEPSRAAGAGCDRGLIVDDLVRVLQEKNFRTGNDGCRDLIAMDRAGRIRALFQVCTAADLAGLHAGAAQLLLNGLDLPGEPLLLLALPRPPGEPLRERLRRLKIGVLVYGWEGDRALFPGLRDLLAGIAP